MSDIFIRTALWIVVGLVVRDAVCNFTCTDGVVTFVKFISQEPADLRTYAVSTLYQGIEGQAITGECIEYCRKSPACVSFTMNYPEVSCHAFRNDFRTNAGLRNSSGSHLFTKLCYKNMNQSLLDKQCAKNRLWTVEITVGAYLAGYEYAKLENLSRIDCISACLDSKACRSASYDSELFSCVLSKESRWTQRQAFREGQNLSKSYVENGCVSSGATSCIFEKRMDLTIRTLDALEFASDEAECERICTGYNRFSCNSYGFLNKQCALSSDAWPLDLPQRNGSLYGHRSCAFDDCRGLFSYERTSGYTLSEAAVSPLPMSTETGLPVTTAECATGCDLQDFGCQAVVMDADSDQCLRLDRNSQGRSKVFVRNESITYLEKICLRVGDRARHACRHRVWSFERRPGHRLPERYYREPIKSVQSRRDCEEQCLNERQFACQSALYDEDTISCRLSNHRAHGSLPLETLDNLRISYLENLCIDRSSLDNDCRYYERKGLRTRFVDAHFRAISLEQCKKLCNSDKRFHCVALSYSEQLEGGHCLLSSMGDLQWRVPNNFADYLAENSNYSYFEKNCTNEILEPTPRTGDTDNSTAATTEATTDLPSQEPATDIVTAEPTATVPVTEEQPTIVATKDGISTTSPSITNEPPTVSTADVTTESISTERSPGTVSTASSTGTVIESTTTTAMPSLDSRCPSGHRLHFERVPGFEPIQPKQLALLCYGDCNREQIVQECVKKCRGHSTCRGFVVDYRTSFCYASQTKLLQVDLIVSKHQHRDYFDVVCIPTLLDGSCSSRSEKLWASEKIIDQQAALLQPRLELLRISLTECRHLCLEQNFGRFRNLRPGFVCRSFAHDRQHQVCRLYDVDRVDDSVQLSFAFGWDFYENLCAARAVQCKYEPFLADTYIATVMVSEPVLGIHQCQRACDEERGFRCRSFAFVQNGQHYWSNRCLLSSDGKSSSRSGLVQYLPGAYYFELRCRPVVYPYTIA